MEKIELNVNLVNAILNYLGTRPYGEVFQMIQAIQQEGAVQIKAPENQPPETPVQ
jgi:hypothetical protein